VYCLIVLGWTEVELTQKENVLMEHVGHTD